MLAGGVFRAILNGSITVDILRDVVVLIMIIHFKILVV